MLTNFTAKVRSSNKPRVRLASGHLIFIHLPTSTRSWSSPTSLYISKTLLPDINWRIIIIFQIVSCIFRNLHEYKRCLLQGRNPCTPPHSAQLSFRVFFSCNVRAKNLCNNVTILHKIFHVYNL